MATRKQTAANRRNAKKSTGPRTDAGKAKVAQNAVTHGLTARACVLPDEDAAEHAAFVDGVRADLAPMGMLEEAFVVQVADGMWRLLRTARLEAACIARELAQAADRAGRLREIPGLPPSTAQGEEHALGTAFLKLDADGLPNSLARYEAAIQRGVERGLKLLREAQKARLERERMALRSKPDFLAAQAGQGFPDDERSRSRRAEQAGNQPPSQSDSSGGEAAAADVQTAATRQASWDECPETQRANWDPWPEARPNVIGPGYAPARPGERIEHRQHGNTRYIVRVPIED